MTQDQKKNLESQMWGIANLLPGKISADDALLSSKCILGFSFFKPLLKKQQKIADCLSLMDKAINKLKHQIEQTIQFKKGLLQRMFI